MGLRDSATVTVGNGVSVRRCKPLRDRILERISKSAAGCWLWTANVDRDGYGYLNRGRLGEGNVRAHRASYEVFVGPIPPGLYVLHRCDVPGCVNPEHLFVGTQKTNLQDAAAKNRTARGERVSSAKLTADDVI